MVTVTIMKYIAKGHVFPLSIETMEPHKSIHMIISGSVQGVFFRSTAKQMAETLGLKGWAKNLPTGQVEVYAKGDFKALQKLMNWCHEGPPRAEVQEVDVVWDEDLGSQSSFEVL